MEIDQEKPAQISEHIATDVSSSKIKPDLEAGLEKEPTFKVEQGSLVETIILKDSTDSIANEMPESKELALAIPEVVEIRGEVKEVKKAEVGMISWLASLLPD